jgi:hypothetical protein
MTKLMEVDANGAKFTIEYPDVLSEVFIEGVTTLAVGYPYSKILLHRVPPPSPGSDPRTKVEHRTAVLQLVMPTGALLDFCAKALASATEDGGKGLKAAAEAMSTQFAKKVDEVQSLA